MAKRSKKKTKQFSSPLRFAAIFATIAVLSYFGISYITKSGIFTGVSQPAAINYMVVEEAQTDSFEERAAVEKLNKAITVAERLKGKVSDKKQQELESKVNNAAKTVNKVRKTADPKAETVAENYKTADTVVSTTTTITKSGSASCTGGSGVTIPVGKWAATGGNITGTDQRACVQCKAGGTWSAAKACATQYNTDPSSVVLSTTLTQLYAGLDYTPPANCYRGSTIYPNGSTSRNGDNKEEWCSNGSWVATATKKDNDMKTYCNNLGLKLENGKCVKIPVAEITKKTSEDAAVAQKETTQAALAHCKEIANRATATVTCEVLDDGSVKRTYNFDNKPAKSSYTVQSKSTASLTGAGTDSSKNDSIVRKLEKTSNTGSSLNIDNKSAKSSYTVQSKSTASLTGAGTDSSKNDSIVRKLEKTSNTGSSLNMDFTKSNNGNPFLAPPTTPVIPESEEDITEKIFVGIPAGDSAFGLCKKEAGKDYDCVETGKRDENGYKTYKLVPIARSNTTLIGDNAGKSCQVGLAGLFSGNYLNTRCSSLCPKDENGKAVYGEYDSNTNSFICGTGIQSSTSTQIITPPSQYDPPGTKIGEGVVCEFGHIYRHGRNVCKEESETATDYEVNQEVAEPDSSLKQIGESCSNWITGNDECASNDCRLENTYEGWKNVCSSTIKKPTETGTLESGTLTTKPDLCKSKKFSNPDTGIRDLFGIQTVGICE